MIELLPIEILLLEYAAGSLNSAEALIVATHMALNPAARKKVSTYEAIGGEIIHEAAPAPLCAHCLDSVLEKIEQPLKNPVPAAKAALPDTEAPKSGIPPELYNLIYAVCQHDNTCWSKMSRGVEKMDLHLKASPPSKTRLRLMRLAPNEATPCHAHIGREITLVLEGGYSDAFGHYKKGDISIISGRQTTHRPLADPEGCLCLTLTEAPLYFDDFLVRLLNIFRMI